MKIDFFLFWDNGVGVKAYLSYQDVLAVSFVYKDWNFFCFGVMGLV